MSWSCRVRGLSLLVRMLLQFDAAGGVFSTRTAELIFVSVKLQSSRDCYVGHFLRLFPCGQ